MARAALREAVGSAEERVAAKAEAARGEVAAAVA